LIQINAEKFQMPNFSPNLEPGGIFIMPTETIIIVAGITLAFAALALTLAWADIRTRNLNTPDSNG